MRGRRHRAWVLPGAAARRGAAATGWTGAALTGLILIAACAVGGPKAVAASSPSSGAGVATWAGTWRRLPPAPFSRPESLTAQWTGTRLFAWNTAGTGAHNAAAAFGPAGWSWRRLHPPQDRRFGAWARSVWTGREMLVLSQSGFAYAPATGRWRRFRARGGAGVVVWTGRALIVWGGGCCGDQSDEGFAYDPAADRWRALPPSPLGARQSPLGVWTGREVLIAGGHDARATFGQEMTLKDAAAYDPRTDTWRRLSPMPARQALAEAVWTGREMLVLGGSASRGSAYDPRTDRWRRLHSLGQRRHGTVVWTGTRAVIWGGVKRTGAGWDGAVRGLAYDPVRDRWSVLPRSPVATSSGNGGFAVWAGRRLIVWGRSGWADPRGGWATFTPRIR